MIYLAAILLFALSAGLIWLLVWLEKNGRIQRVRFLILAIILSLMPSGLGLLLLFLRHLVLQHP